MHPTELPACKIWVPWEKLQEFRRIKNKGLLTSRIYSCVPLADWARLVDEIKRNGKGDNWLRIGGLKGYVDGSLGSHTAAMLRPYIDKQMDSGLFVTPPDSLFLYTR